MIINDNEDDCYDDVGDSDIRLVSISFILLQVTIQQDYFLAEEGVKSGVNPRTRRKSVEMFKVLFCIVWCCPLACRSLKNSVNKEIDWLQNCGG